MINEELRELRESTKPTAGKYLLTDFEIIEIIKYCSLFEPGRR